MNRILAGCMVMVLVLTCGRADAAGFRLLFNNDAMGEIEGSG